MRPANPKKVTERYRKIAAGFGYHSEHEFYMAEYITKEKNNARNWHYDRHKPKHSTKKAEK